MLLVALLVGATDARAHGVGVSRGDYRLSGNVVSATLTFSRVEVAPSVSEPELPAWLFARLRVTTQGRECSGRLERVEAIENDGLAVKLDFTCPLPPAEIDVDSRFVASLSAGHRHLLHFSLAGASTDFVASRSQTLLHVAVRSVPDHQQHEAGTARSFVVMGFEHILTGYDHLLFLVGLLIVLRPARSLIWAITSFTLAHSITLSLATLGIASPSPSIIEPLIALSIAYVGIENWFVRDAVGRWRLTFLFGLIHGFGFAGALREISLPSAQVPLALFSFNLGVEMGQLAVVGIALPLMLLAERQGWFAVRRVKLMSASIAAMGLVWFVTRVVAVT
jgi:hypothetical protein